MPDVCRACRRSLTWSAQQRQFFRCIQHFGLTREEAAEVMPRCQKCVTVLLGKRAKSENEGERDLFGHPSGPGPTYPDLGADVAKLRRGSDRQKHGAAVLAAIRKSNKQALARCTNKTWHWSNSASGTTHNKGADILAAVAKRQRGALAACAAGPRCDPLGRWQLAYDNAMRQLALHRRGEA
jgi:hypothetical protein